MSVSGERAVGAGDGAVDRRRRRWSEAQKRQIGAAQLGYLLEGIDRRNPVRT